MNKLIKNAIWKLNGNTVTRELLMVPIIYCRDKLIDMRNIKFILRGQRRLKKYRKIHIGERCFIIGNGPSLVPQDLEKIKDEFCFAANRIYDIYPRTNWRPTYYGIQDYFVLKEISQEVENEENGAKVRFIVANRPKYMCHQMKSNAKNEFFYLGTCISENRSIKITDRFDKIVGHGGTITYAMIQLAIYMGFTKIYLLGVDHNYQNFLSDKGQFDKNAHTASHFAGARSYKNLKINNVPSKKGPVYVSTKAYQKAETYSRQHGIRIYNATRGGCLEVFERVSLDDVIRGDGGGK